MNGRVSRRPDTGLTTEPLAFGRKRKHLCYSEQGEGGGRTAGEASASEVGKLFDWSTTMGFKTEESPEKEQMDGWSVWCEGEKMMS